MKHIFIHDRWVSWGDSRKRRVNKEWEYRYLTESPRLYPSSRLARWEWYFAQKELRKRHPEQKP